MYFYLSQRLSQPPIQILHKYSVYLYFYIINCVISDYIKIWCKKNGYSMRDKDINDAVTEQVSYARKRLKNAMKKTVL